jgi:ABC-type bacteriocin/lantibiotic exporter with double-glycine peptidase domain
MIVYSAKVWGASNMSDYHKEGPIFDLQEVWFSYPGSQPVEALRRINLQIDPGEYIAIIGSNGSGKSTLARLLNALLLPTRGHVLVEGVPTTDAARPRWCFNGRITKLWPPR